MLLPSLILTFATLISATHAQAADCSTPWRGGSIARMFAAPFNVFANNAPLLTLNCTQNAYKITVGDNSSTLYIYKDAYLTTDGDTFTQNVPLTPDTTQQIGDWIIGRATATIPYFTSTAPTNYLAFYSCVKTAAGFQCGCSSRTRCSTPDTGNFIWHLGGFKTQTPQTQGVVTEGATATTAATATAAAAVMGRQAVRGAKSTPQEVHQFTVFDMTLHTDKPADLAARGFVPLPIVYEYHFYDRGESREAMPRDDIIRKLARDASSKGEMLNVDLERWKLPGEVDKYIHVIDTIKDEAPQLRVGLYVAPPKRDYWRAVKGEGSEKYRAWQRENDQLKALADKVDILFPNAYTFYDDRDNWVKYAVAQISEARRLAPGKPVYLTVWPQYHDSNKDLKGHYIPADFFRLQLETAYKYADGIVIWGGRDFINGGRLPWREDYPWWQEVQRFLKEKGLQ